MNKKLTKYALSFLMLTLVMTPALALAEDDNGDDTYDLGQDKIIGLEIPSETDDLPAIVINVINIVLGLLALIAIVIILIAGFEWMTAGGNEDRVKTAQKRLQYGLIGLVIIFLAYGIATWVLTTLTTVATTSG